MDRIWADPKTWVSGLLTVAGLNKELRDSVEFLQGKNRQVLTERDGADNSTTTPIGDLVLTSHGNDIRVFAKFQVTNAVSSVAWYDVEIDLEGGSTIYASTMTGTPATRGLIAQTAPQEHAVVFFVILENIPAGTHTYRIISGGASTTVRKVGRVVQFMVEEYGQSNNYEFVPLLQWINGMNLTAGRLNNQLSDNLNRLFKRKYIVRRYTTGVYVTTSTSFVSMTSEKIHFYSTGRDLVISALHPFHTSVTAALGYFDIKIDDTTWLSSMTSTPLSDGWYNLTSIAVTVQSFYNEAFVRLDEGWHTFEIFYKSSDGASSAVVNSTLSPLIITIEEDGIRA